MAHPLKHKIEEHPMTAREALVAELGIEHMGEEAQDKLLEATIDALMQEVMISVFSYLPEKEYDIIERLAEDDRFADIDAILGRYIADTKIAEIIEEVFTRGIARYKEIMAQHAQK
jgi:hypothetical protein